MPLIWRARSAAGSARITRVAAAVPAVATTAAARTPILASSSCRPLSAMLEISNDTVKPMPDTIAPVVRTGQLIVRRRAPRRSLEVIQVAARMPAGLPIV